MRLYNITDDKITLSTVADLADTDKIYFTENITLDSDSSVIVEKNKVYYVKGAPDTSAETIQISATSGGAVIGFPVVHLVRVQLKNNKAR